MTGSAPSADEILFTLIDMPMAERGPALTLACAGDEALRTEVESLLAAYDGAPGFLEAPLCFAAEALDELREEEGASWVGRRLGSYRLVERLGAGGMGTVYLAERADAEFEQRVAIKLVRPGYLGDEAMARFRTERQLLAHLEHANIARLIDGGTSEEGMPFLVMELVEGLPIDQHCRELGVERRLPFFLDVCSAVAYAHQNLVVHRDLKPSNILVTPGGQVKLLDFGIAKILSPEGEPVEEATRLQAMTPSYASPEQIRNRPITTASDVYSLGVVLYLLLTGRLPYRTAGLSPTEIEAVVCVDEPPLPSVALRSSVEQPTHPWAVGARAMRGDLDNIVMMALRKEPEKRYRTVEQLADDIRRHRDGLPVAARPSTLGYRLGKLARRRALPLAVAAALGTVAIVGTGIGLVRAWQAESEARQEAETAGRVTDFLVELFETSNPLEAASPDITARELLARGVERLGGELGAEPQVRARLLEAVGSVYEALGLYGEGVGLLEESIALRRQELGSDHLEVAKGLRRLGTLLDGAGQRERAEEVLGEAVRITRAQRGDGHIDTAEAVSDLAGVVRARGRYAEAEPLQREALKVVRATYGENHGATISCVNNLALTLEDLGRFEEAEVLFREALATREVVYGAGHLRVATGLHNLGVSLGKQGRADEAEELLRQALDAYRHSVGEEHPQYAIALGALGSQLLAQGELEAAEQIMREGLELRRKAYGEKNERVAPALSNLAGVLRDLGRYDEAEQVVGEALEIVRSVQGEEHPAIGFITQQLAAVRHRRGDRVGAIELYSRAIDHLMGKLPARHIRFALLRGGLGAALMEEGRYDEAEPALLEAHRIALDAEGAESERTAEAAGRLADLYRRWGREAEAQRYAVAAGSAP